MKKNKTFTQKCGGKNTGCTVEFDLPSGITKHRVSDENPTQGQAGTKQTSNGK